MKLPLMLKQVLQLDTRTKFYNCYDNIIILYAFYHGFVGGYHVLNLIRRRRISLARRRISLATLPKYGLMDGY